MTPLIRQDGPAAGMGTRVAAGGTLIRRYLLALTPTGAGVEAALTAASVPPLSGGTGSHGSGAAHAFTIADSVAEPAARPPSAGCRPIWLVVSVHLTHLAILQSNDYGMRVVMALHQARSTRLVRMFARVGSGFWLAGRFRRSPAGPDAHSFDRRGRKEDQRGCYGTQAHRHERGARSGAGIRSGGWWRWIETERFRHVMPPENLEVDGVPAEYPDDAADPPQPSHPQISGSCQGCMDLVYHGCWLPSCSRAHAG